jgi:uncharacterized protein
MGWHSALREACPYLAVVIRLPDADNVRMVGNLLGDVMKDPPFPPPSMVTNA